MTAPAPPPAGPGDAGPESAGAASSATRAERRANRRRRREARAFDSSVPSPCILVCQIDDSSGLCLGCRRSLDEIRDWPILTAEEKRAVLARLPGRGAGT